MRSEFVDHTIIFIQVGPVCNKLRPCENGILCRDKCSAPYFECVYCDDIHTGLHCDVEKGRDTILIYAVIKNT